MRQLLKLPCNYIEVSVSCMLPSSATACVPGSMGALNVKLVVWAVNPSWNSCQPTDGKHMCGARWQVRRSTPAGKPNLKSTRSLAVRSVDRGSVSYWVMQSAPASRAGRASRNRARIVSVTATSTLEPLPEYKAVQNSCAPSRHIGPGALECGGNRAKRHRMTQERRRQSLQWENLWDKPTYGCKSGALG
jgi:hypothetical protein